MKTIVNICGFIGVIVFKTHVSKPELLSIIHNIKSLWISTQDADLDLQISLQIWIQIQIYKVKEQIHILDPIPGVNKVIKTTFMVQVY